MTTELGCPYCIVGGFNFQKMIRNSHDELVCPTCGHVQGPRFACSCVRCQHRRQAETLTIRIANRDSTAAP